VRIQIEMAVIVALALVFAFIPIRRWMLIPASLPIYYFAYRRGGKLGMLCGLIFAVLTLPRAFIDLPHPVVLLENPLEYLAVGMAGFFPMRFQTGEQKTPKTGFDFRGWIYDCRGIILSCCLRFAIIVLGSMVFYAYYFHFSYPAALVFSLVMEAKVFIPGLLLFMVALPWLLRTPVFARSA